MTDESISLFGTRRRHYGTLKPSTSQVKGLTQQHVVSKGETFVSIAVKYQCKVTELKQINRMFSDQIVPGMKLIVPQKSALNTEDVKLSSISLDINENFEKNVDLNDGDDFLKKLDDNILRLKNNVKSQSIRINDLDICAESCHGTRMENFMNLPVTVSPSKKVKAARRRSVDVEV